MQMTIFQNSPVRCNIRIRVRRNLKFSYIFQVIGEMLKQQRISFARCLNRLRMPRTEQPTLTLLVPQVFDETFKKLRFSKRIFFFRHGKYQICFDICKGYYYAKQFEQNTVRLNEIDFQFNELYLIHYSKYIKKNYLNLPGRFIQKNFNPYE